ncbi:hypothetical protein ES288_A04G177000v1 [Gossypium darwinii]|uniref:TF-B3 domain-containing protein n=1 Tax=Gossypium darwinii TaxID=34276 RepID=A0A5D2GYF8_GOSDA|nr:hypothetical protein ES288_A04G177000v1 [Gossypium darwinii]
MFSKKLSRTDINKRLTIPSKTLSFFPAFNAGHAVTIHLEHAQKTWPVLCTIRRGKYKKPVLCGGWRVFVNFNNFNLGDRITMYKVQDRDGSSHFRVEVENSPSASNQHVELVNDANATKSPVMLFGTDLNDEATEMMCCMSKEVKEINFFGIKESDRIAYSSGTSDAGDQRCNLHAREVKLNLTLSPPNVEEL